LVLQGFLVRPPTRPPTRSAEGRPRSSPLKRGTPPKRRKAISPASPAQRKRIAERSCVVCARQPCDPAHLIDRSLGGTNDERAVVPLCRDHHRAYDEERLSILEFLEPRFREELAYAVENFGLLTTLQRVTNSRWVPEKEAA
jgi:hypothetical protein